MIKIKVKMDGVSKLKFKVGDIVSHRKDGWYCIAEILSMRNDMYVAKVLDHSRVSMLGKIDTDDDYAIDELFELDAAFMAKREFQKDLEKLLNE